MLNAQTIDAARERRLAKLSPKERLMMEYAYELNRLGGLCSAVDRLTRILEGRLPTSKRTLMVAECEGRDYFQELHDRRAKHAIELVENGEILVSVGLKVRRFSEFKTWVRGDFSSIGLRHSRRESAAA